MTVFSRLSLPFLVALSLSFGAGCFSTRAAAHEPLLCEIDNGRWCSPCTGPDCAEGDTGWLCCSGGVCVPVATFDECKLGICGWCKSYTESTTPAGNTVAVCHD